MIIYHDPTGGLAQEKAYHALLHELFLPVKNQKYIVLTNVTSFQKKIGFASLRMLMLNLQVVNNILQTIQKHLQVLYTISMATL
jgi:hypothetical protein